MRKTFLLLMVIAISGCSESATPTPAFTVTPLPTETATLVPTVAATSTVQPTLTRTATPAPSRTPTTIPSPTVAQVPTVQIPRGYEAASDPDVQVGFVRPRDWQQEKQDISGAGGYFRVLYSQSFSDRKTMYFVINRYRDPFATSLSQQELYDLAATFRKPDGTVLGENLNPIVDRNLSGGMTYRSKELFGMFLLVWKANQLYLFRWESDARAESDLRAHYAVMVPRIRFQE